MREVFFADKEGDDYCVFDSSSDPPKVLSSWSDMDTAENEGKKLNGLAYFRMYGTALPIRWKIESGGVTMMKLCTESEYLYCLARARRTGELTERLEASNPFCLTVVWSLNGRTVAEKTSFHNASTPTEYVINTFY
jgi:hypothetical protein